MSAENSFQKKYGYSRSKLSVSRVLSVGELFRDRRVWRGVEGYSYGGSMIGARHTAAPTSRAFSCCSYGQVNAVSHPFNHNGLNLDTAHTPKRLSGMAPLHDVSRAWCKQPEALNECWPATKRDMIGADKHAEMIPWSSKTGA